MENYKEELEKLKKESYDLTHRINIAISEINEPKFEVGKRYVDPLNTETMGFYKGLGENNYGFNSGKWSNKVIMTNPNYWRLASKLEVEEALTKEAINRGLVIGNYALFGTNKVKRLISSSDYKWNYFGFTVGNDLLMDSNGIWAEVYKPKTIDEWAEKFSTFHISKTMPIVDSFKNFITENNFKLPE